MPQPINLDCPVLLTDPSVACWCLTGAMATVYGADKFNFAYEKVYRAIVKLFPYYDDDGRPVVSFNDDPSTTHEMVMQVLEEAGV